MARPSSKDPLDKFRWTVSIDGFTKLGFTSVETPSHTINTRRYAEGGAHLFPKQIVDSIEYRPITLNRGVTSDRSFHEWARGPFDILSSNQKLPTILPEEVGQYRREVTIQHVDRAGRVVRTYKLKNAFVIGYKPASDFDASADDALSIESLTLAYEEYTIVGQDGNELSPFSIKEVAKRLIRNIF